MLNNKGGYERILPRRVEKRGQPRAEGLNPYERRIPMDSPVGSHAPAQRGLVPGEEPTEKESGLLQTA